MNGFWWIWIITIVGLLFLYVRERMINHFTRKELNYISEKTREFTESSNSLLLERLQIVTDDRELRELLQSINSLLDHSSQLAADYTRTERAMRMMLANVSHDLKTPLTVIMGYAEMLTRNADLAQDERQRMLNQVYKKTVEVHELINAFFDLAKLEADDFDISLSVIDACEICRHRILAYYDLLSEGEFKVDINLPDEAVLVYANEEALSRVLDNLLSNAVRYGADGGYLGLSLTQAEGKILIEVKDRGRGIPKTDLFRVFERMYTMEDSRNRNIQGSGLGLSIAKRLTERLGGRIDLESVPGLHTSFTVTLPATTTRIPQESKK
ncbi:sensor histidine kinase [Paenibacillus endoradicis]|uniref:sensor histidine kinase n=1 Tax=Paenibacillus endoradicis TaxID=2972487 RepID=UPI0021596BAE|nr:HAMP domain-containing sensor histidine kinase [Paenibacillus endoradicis]MCR8658612.1 HAMP domain-containing histidine kinase [Paenibacillus endoradicis]